MQHNILVLCGNINNWRHQTDTGYRNRPWNSSSLYDEIGWKDYSCSVAIIIQYDYEEVNNKLGTRTITDTLNTQETTTATTQRRRHQQLSIIYLRLMRRPLDDVDGSQVGLAFCGDDVALPLPRALPDGSRFSSRTRFSM